VRIASSAPTRIDLAGGTIDIWPLYLFHPSAQTLNVAISLRARASVTARRDGRVRLISQDTGQAAEADGWAALDVGGPLRLLARLVRHFRVDGIELETRADSPLGAGIAGSSALNVAVCGALAAWTGASVEPEALLQIAMNVEAQAIDVPTGVQDYRPAMYGGVSAVELGVDGVRRVALSVDPAELERRLVLAYTGASRNSGINNWDVMKRHIDGDRAVFDRFERIRDVAVAMRAALERGDWAEVGRQVAAEWTNRKALAPGVSTPHIDELIAGARAAGALAAKVCGAGGGGCLFCFCEPEAGAGVRRALAAGGAQVLDFHVERDGLRVERHGPTG
jgi:D-glycero-alpha-D-manno-heptose-7-phosphate kinase